MELQTLTHPPESFGPSPQHGPSRTAKSGLLVYANKFFKELG